MKKLLIFFQDSIYPILLLVLTTVLALKNYIPGTILSGWDTLHPEFNLSLYFRRAFFGVWQEHQGVGAVASQSHVGELTRLPVVWLTSLILPQDLVRYTFFFLCLFVGALGLYFLSYHLLKPHAAKITRTSAFLGATFYILNLTTVQQFSVPLEMFAIHFAMIPWLFYLAIRYLKEGGKKDLFWFCIATLLSSGMAHTATLYYVYISCLGLFLLSAVILHVEKTILFRSGIVLGATLFLNSFWILPNLYFIKNHGMEVATSKIHSSFSDEAFLQSQNYGTIKDLVLQRNFLFNWKVFDYETNNFVELMGPWQIHLNDPFVEIFGISFFVLGILGIIFALYKGDKYVLSFVLPLALCAIFWINANGPLKPFFEYFRSHSVLFKEGLRFPFTKFSIILTATLSVFLAFSLNQILQLIHRIKVGYLMAATVLVANIYFAWPAFEGNLIAKNDKVTIPQEYSQAFDWFTQKDPTHRVAKLPIHTMWGWNYHSWRLPAGRQGYEGAGFTWFGIPQPTFDREFDRWSHFNEDFYSQAAFAVYSEDAKVLENTLKKYGVKYLLLDESVVSPGGTQEILHLPQLKNLISLLNYQEVAKFGFLTVYDTGLTQANRLDTPENPVGIQAALDYAQIDSIYGDFGEYFETDGGAIFPFVNFDPRGPVKMTLESGEIVFDNTRFRARVSAMAGEPTIEDLRVHRGFDSPYNCDLDKKGVVQKSYTDGGILYRAVGNGVSCDYLNFLNLEYRKAYVLHLKGENREGRALKIYLYNHTTGKMDLEEVLPIGDFDQFYFIYPKNLSGSGYTLNFETRSYGRVASENFITAVEFYPVDYKYLSGVTLGDSKPGIYSNDLKIVDSYKYGTWAYKVDVQGSGMIKLSQGYEDGWVAFQPQGGLKLLLRSNFGLLNHFRFDSWANGWDVSAPINGENSVLYIFFWPQLLEWGGVLVAMLTFLMI